MPLSLPRAPGRSAACLQTHRLQARDGTPGPRPTAPPRARAPERVQHALGALERGWLEALDVHLEQRHVLRNHRVHALARDFHALVLALVVDVPARIRVGLRAGVRRPRPRRHTAAGVRRCQRARRAPCAPSSAGRRVHARAGARRRRWSAGRAGSPVADSRRCCTRGRPEQDSCGAVLSTLETYQARSHRQRA